MKQYISPLTNILRFLPQDTILAPMPLASSSTAGQTAPSLRVPSIDVVPLV